MKKNIPMRIASILLTAVLITSGAVSGTFAKYTAEATASSSVQVAKWSFKVGGTDITTSNSFTFDLFNTVYDTTSSKYDTAETHIVSGKIAPGSKGYFHLIVTNSSDVTATYTVKLDQTQTSALVVPIEYQSPTDDGGTATWKSAKDYTCTKSLSAGESLTINFYWRWPLDKNTIANDTTIGTGNNRRLSVTATVTATQVD